MGGGRGSIASALACSRFPTGSWQAPGGCTGARMSIGVGDLARTRASGIFSFDLIAGLPYQTRESWQDSLEELAALAPEHVSIYLLEIDEGSRLGGEVLARRQALQRWRIAERR